jgi:hypothetical protein
MVGQPFRLLGPIIDTLRNLDHSKFSYQAIDYPTTIEIFHPLIVRVLPRASYFSVKQLAMESWRPDTLNTDKRSPVLGINGLNRHDWTAIPSAGTYHRHAAEPGSSSLMNASPPQYPPLDYIYDEDFRLSLDPLVSCSSKYTQLNLAKFDIEPNSHI